MSVLQEAHPIIKALRGLCMQDLPRYEAIIALMRSSLFTMKKHGLAEINQDSLDQFLVELAEENEICFDREDTFEILAENTRDLGLLKALFAPPPIDIKRKSR